jgi:hypothetical protein
MGAKGGGRRPLTISMLSGTAMPPLGQYFSCLLIKRARADPLVSGAKPLSDARADRSIGLSCLAFACAAGLAAAVLGCADTERETLWTVDRAESVTTIRGMGVRVVQCRGLGTPDEREAGRYRRFACEAGARRNGESYDTVAIRYVIRVRAAGGYVLENVRFTGPGVP